MILKIVSNDFEELVVGGRIIHKLTNLGGSSMSVFVTLGTYFNEGAGVFVKGDYNIWY